MKNDAFIPFLTQMCDLARQGAWKYFRKPLTVELKSAEQPVTIADREIETVWRNRISKQFPLDGVLGEEFGHQPSSNGRTWVLDPIDGTKAFITGMPTFACLIALYDEDQGVIASAIELPGIKERFIAVKGQGCVWIQRDGSAPCSVRGYRPLDQRLVASTTPDMFLGENARSYEAFSQQTAGRRFGGDAYIYGLLAAGFYDHVIEADLQCYDFLAPSLVISEAGGQVSDWQGKALDLKSDGRVLCSASPQAHQQALTLLNKS